jgi:nucleoside 2-deoxyribosyltransferase
MTRRPTVYLAGPIVNCDTAEAHEWRVGVTKRIREHGIIGISPLRCEPPVNGRYDLGYTDDRFGTARAISSKNLFDVQSCTITLAYIPAVLSKRTPPYGTISELAWARALGKPTILVTDDEFIVQHPVVNSNASWVLPTLKDAEEVIVGLLADYA